MVDEEELSALLRRGNPDLTDREVHAIFLLVDRDGSGAILFDEFVDFLFMQDGDSSSSTSGSTEDEGSSSRSSSRSSPRAGSSASDSEGEALALATQQARRVSAAMPGVGALGESSLLLEGAPEAEHVELSGVQELPQVAGVYLRRREDWLVAASSRIDEYSEVFLNTRPIYEQEVQAKAKAKAKGKRAKERKEPPPHYLFYGWTKHWGRWGQAGWFVSQRLPEDQEPVDHYLLFNPSSDAMTPDLCTAIWETQKGHRDKCMLCEAPPPRHEGQGFDQSNFLADELWEMAGGKRRGSMGATPLDLGDGEPGWEWGAQPGEDSWPEPEAEPAEEPPPGESQTPEPDLAAEGETGSDAAAAAARRAAEARRMAARRLQQGANGRRMSDDVAIMRAPGFKVITKQDQRLGWLERNERKRLEEERRRAAARARASSKEADDEASLRGGLDHPEQQEGLEGDEGRADNDPGQDGMSELVGKTSRVVDGWGRLSQLHERPCLFVRILPDDVLCDASTGNYWFLSACAAVAEYPAWVQAMFGRATRLSPEGRYSVRLYHPGREVFAHVAVSDGVPTTDGCPAFAGITGEGAIWVALVEKAFAKLCGSYADTERGMTAYGLLYLCGGSGAESWKRHRSCLWRRAYAQWRGKGPGAGGLDRRRAEGLVDDGRAHNAEDVWEVLRRCMTLCQPVVCGVDREACSPECGLLPDRPYSLLSARDVPTAMGRVLRMVHLRNPFGAEEWRGRWGQGSEAWGENPAVGLELELERAGGGAFWMSYSDFLKHFDAIDFVKKSMPVQGCCRARRAVGQARLWAADKTKPRRVKSTGKS